MNNIEEKTLSDVKANELGTELGKRGETLESSLVTCGGISINPSIKTEGDVHNDDSISVLSKSSAEPLETIDAEIVKVDALANQQVSGLTIDETPSKKDCAEINEASRNILNIVEGREEKNDDDKEKIEEGSEKNLTKEIIKEGQNGAQATITTEIIRSKVTEQDDVMVVEKQEAKAITATNIVKEDPSTDAFSATATTTASRDLSSSIWIRNITNTTKAVELKALFSKHGKVVTAKIFTTKNKLSPTCFGFVVLSDASSADLCVQKLNRMNFKGRIINVEKADRSNLSQINKSANGAAINNNNSAAPIQNNPSENSLFKGNGDSSSGKANPNINTSQSKTHESEKISTGEAKRSPRVRIISTSNASSKEAHNSSTKWRGSGFEKRDFAGSRSFGSSRSRMNASYATGRIMGIRHGRAGRISGGRNVRNSSAPGISDNFNRLRFGSSNRRSTGRRREEESRRSSQRHKPNDVRNSSRRSPANSKNNNDSTDKEDLIRFMRRKEEEHRKKEEELVMEREREKIRYEREKLERDKLELETLRLQAQLAQATQFQFAAVAGLPQGGAAAVSVPLITGTGDSSTSALHNQHFGDGGFNHRRERESAMPTAFSSERRSIDMSAKSEMSRSKSRTSKQNDRDERSDRFRHSSRSAIGPESTRSSRYRNKSRSRSPLRRSGTSRHGSLNKEHHTGGALYQGDNERERPAAIYSGSRNIPMQVGRNNSPHSKRVVGGRSSEFGWDFCLTFLNKNFSFLYYDNKRYFYNTGGIDSTSKDAGFAAARGDHQMSVRPSNVRSDRQVVSSPPHSNERSIRRDYYSGGNQYNTSGTASYTGGGGTLQSDSMYGSRIQQQSQNQALSSSRPTGEMFGNGVFTQPSLGSGNDTALVSGYDSQHTPQQFGSGSNGYYQQGSVSDWGGQMDVSGGTNERNAAATRSFLGGGSNVGSSSTQWNSGGDWGGTLGANTNRAGTSSRYNTSYNKPASGGYSSGGRRY
uniref:RRM domain-containing protein n=1 Tax=Meloidogyne incognita TaxID=6306 RepID=A0A914L2V2_MELIC